MFLPELTRVTRVTEGIRQHDLCSTTRVARVSLTKMRNINNPDLQTERLILFSDKSKLFYQGHTGLRSCTIRCQ